MSAINALAATLSQTQMAIAQSVMKTAAQSEQLMANLLAESVDSVPAATGRGQAIDLSV